MEPWPAGHEATLATDSQEHIMSRLDQNML